MKKKFYTLLLLSVIVAVCGIRTVSAHDACGFDYLHQQQMQDPALAAMQAQRDFAIRNFLDNRNQNARILPGGCDKPTNIVYVLPVVIHIVNVNSTTNLITTVQADSALAKCNRDLLSTGFQFALAKRDSNGNATTGINYIDGSTIPGYSQYGVKYSGTNGVSINQLSLNNWSTTKYLNVYVVNNFAGDNSVGGIVGNMNVMIKWDAFYQGSAAFSHEIGHFLGLYHTYVSGTTCPTNANCLVDGDQICSTPPIRISDRDSSPCYLGDISVSVYNLMGTRVTAKLVDEQIDRMKATFFTYLWSLALSEVLIPVTTGNEVSLDAVENESMMEICADTFTPQITLRNIGNNSLVSFEVQTYVDAVLASTTTVSPVGFLKGSNRTFNLNPTPITTGNHTIKCVLTKVNGVNGDYFTMNNSVCGDISFYKQSYSVSGLSTNGTVIGTGNYDCGTQVNLSATAYNPAGYEFNRWIENNTTVSTVSNYSFIVSGNRELNAEFKLRSFSITTSCNSGSGFVTGGGSYTYGSTVVAKATAKSGYKFTNWTENGVIVSTDSVYSFSISNNRTITANFTAVVTGITQHNFENLNVYPNPAQDWVTIKGFQNNIVTVYDLLGAIVAQQEIVNEQIDISGLPAGVYMLRLEDQEKIYTGKIVKQ